MAAVRPFPGLRFNEEAGSLDQLTAPPYETLTPGDRDQLVARSSRNVVHLTFPEAKGDDRSKYVRYARSAASLSEWRRDGTLVKEAAPAFYRYTQETVLPRFGETSKRVSLIALLQIDPQDGSRIRVLEESTTKAREDRLRLLEATRSHFEAVSGIVQDEDGSFRDALHSIVGHHSVSMDSSGGTHHVLEPITDPETIARLTELLRGREVDLIDGAAIFDAAKAFRESIGPKDKEIPEDYVPVALGSSKESGIAIVPNCRVLNRSSLGREEILARIATLFAVHETHSSRLVHELESARSEGRRMYAAAFEGGMGYTLTPKDEASHGLFQNSDVAVVRNLILGELLEVRNAEDISSMPDPHRAIAAVDGGAKVAFLTQGISTDQLYEVLASGNRLSPQSVYAYPRLRAGLVLWSLNDF